MPPRVANRFIQTSRKPWNFTAKQQALLIPRMKRSSEQTCLAGRQALRALARKPRVLNPRLFIFVLLS